MLDRVCWLILALIHLMPALALVRPALLGALYGVTPGSTSFLLLHHRAALFSVIVVVCVWAALDASTRQLASVAVAISMVSFLMIYLAGRSPASLRTIAIADTVGLPFLIFVAWRAFTA